jgi:hypothetical protein
MGFLFFVRDSNPFTYDHRTTVEMFCDRLEWKLG